MRALLLVVVMISGCWCGRPELEPEQPCGAPVAAMAVDGQPVPELERAWGFCDGELIANAESNAWWVEHPETHACTFRCEWNENQVCDDARKAAKEPRCSPEYSVKLQHLCEQHGGRCELGRYLPNKPGVLFCVPQACE